MSDIKGCIENKETLIQYQNSDRQFLRMLSMRCQFIKHQSDVCEAGVAQR